MAFLTEKQSENRRKNDIERSDKTRLADGGIFHAVLLEHSRSRKRESAADTAENGDSLVDRLDFSSEQGRLFETQQYERNQYQTSKEIACRVEDERLHIVVAHRLEHKGDAPDDRRQRQAEAAFEVFAFVHILYLFISDYFITKQSKTQLYPRKMHTKP